jgi:hypothetical protein
VYVACFDFFVSPLHYGYYCPTPEIVKSAQKASLFVHNDPTTTVSFSGSLAYRDLTMCRCNLSQLNPFRKIALEPAFRRSKIAAHLKGTLNQYLRQKSGCFSMDSADFRGLENPVVD